MRILLFSVLRERLGAREIRLEIERPLSVAEFLDRMIEQVPALSEYKPSLRLAVNQEYAHAETVVMPGDEVALITPTSGG